MRIVRLGEREYVVGLSWRAASKDDHKAIRAYSREEGSAYAAVMRHGDVVSIGFTDGDKTKVPSAAAMLCATGRSAHGAFCVIEDIEQKDRSGSPLYWVCAIGDDGTPNLDMLGTEQKVLEQVQNISGFGGITVHTKLAQFPQGDGERDFRDLVAETAYKPNIVLVNRSSLLIRGGVAAAVVIVVGLLLQQHFSKSRDRALRVAALRASATLNARVHRRMAHNTFEHAYRAKLERYVRAISGPPAGALVHTWFAAAKRMPLMIDGWSLENMRCAGLLCSFGYERVHGSIDAFLREASVYGEASPDLPVGAHVRVRVKVADRAQPDMNTLPQGKQFVLALVSLFQDHDATGIRFKVHSPKWPAPIKDPLGKEHAVPYAMGQFRVKGWLLFEFPELARMINVPNLAVTSLTLDFRHLPTQVPWTLEGSYVVR